MERGGEGKGGEGKGGEGEGREGKGRGGKGRGGGREGKGKGREGKGRERKGREGKGEAGGVARLEDRLQLVPPSLVAHRDVVALGRLHAARDLRRAHDRRCGNRRCEQKV